MDWHGPITGAALSMLPREVYRGLLEVLVHFDGVRRERSHDLTLVLGGVFLRFTIGRFFHVGSRSGDLPSHLGERPSSSSASARRARSFLGGVPPLAGGRLGTTVAQAASAAYLRRTGFWRETCAISFPGGLVEYVSDTYLN